MTPIRTATPDDLNELYALTLDENQAKDQGYFERCFEEQTQGFREVLVIDADAEIAGYCHYQRRPGYQPFRSLGIAEIQDLYVRPRQRRKGLASSLVLHCCDKAVLEGHDLIGIGVGLSSGYGKAQQLYAKLGFAPDGGGIVYERQAVVPGQSYRVDDELCLMMIKRLK